MVVVVAPDQADAAIARLRQSGEEVWRIGVLTERAPGAAAAVVR